MKKRVLIAAILALLPALALGAGVTIWGATNRAPATGTMRVPVDISASSSPGYLSVDALKAYIAPGPVRVLCTGAAPGMSVTGTTAETVLAPPCTVPAGAMGPNGRVRITTVWSWTNSANTKQTRVRFGGVSGTSYFSFVGSTTASMRGQAEIANRNSASSQIGGPQSSTVTGWNASGVANVTSSVNTNNDTDIIIAGQLSNASDTMTLESYLVELLVP